jgi:hypothetical protein
MVWSKQEFEREVRRQLIELASLRKRVPPTKDLLERIDRLETSHHYLLRKLVDYFKQLEERTSTQTKQGSAKQGSGAPAEAEAPAEVFETDPSHAASQLETEALESQEVSTGNLVLALEKLQNTYPDVMEACAACGKLLISVILAGGEVAYQAPAWYHAACLKGGEGFGKQGTLN